MTHDISMEPSGLRFRALANETLLSAAMRQGVGLPYGCKDGACGSCKCRKISGTVIDSVDFLREPAAWIPRVKGLLKGATGDYQSTPPGKKLSPFVHHRAAPLKQVASPVR
jgi:hypothetical protein